MKLGESGGEEGVKKLGKRAGGDEESLEEEGAGGGGEAAPGSSSTKKEEKIINSNTTSSPPPNPSLAQAPAALQPSHSQDQHHFLRSSVRPQSKRLKKDSQASSSVGSSAAVKGKGTLFWHPPEPTGGWGVDGPPVCMGVVILFLQMPSFVWFWGRSCGACFSQQLKSSLCPRASTSLLPTLLFPKMGGFRVGGGGVLGLYVEEENKNSIIGADLPFLHFIT